MIGITQALRGISQSFPGTAPLVRQATDILRQIQLKMMQSAQPSEGPAPPVSG